MDSRATKAFKEYLDLHNNHQTQAAQAIGYSSARINQVVSGARPMSDACAARIHAVTDGKVSMFELSSKLRQLQPNQ